MARSRNFAIRLTGLALVLMPLAGAGCRAPAPVTGPTGCLVTIADEDAFVDETLSTLRRNFFSPAYVDRTRGVIRTRPETSKQWFEFWRGDAPGGYQVWESSLHTIRRTVTVNWELVPGTGRTVAGALVAQEPMTPVRTGPTQRSGLHADSPKLQRQSSGPVGTMTPVRGGQPAASGAPRQAPPAQYPPARTPTASGAGVMTPVGGRSPSVSAPAAPRGAAPIARPKGPATYRVTIEVSKERYNAPERQVTTVSGALGIYSERLPTTEGVRASRDASEAWLPLGRDGLLEAQLLDAIVSAAGVRERSPLPASPAK
jgi:hypothetical protein